VVDGTGGFVIVGQTDSPNWPTVRALQAGYQGGGDGFLLRLTP
jgi:hypothetical protein